MRFFLGLLTCLACLRSVEAETPMVHGPVIQWHRDPLTAATFVWIERDQKNEGVVSTDWAWGKAGFGYGDGDDRTELPQLEDKHPRVYIATKFDLKEAPAGAVTLDIDYDDAFVAFLNGVEVARSENLKGNGAAGKVGGSHEAGDREKFSIPASAFRLGPNLLSLEGHNRSAGSSDLTLSPLLHEGDRMFVGKEADWAYLAGRDPEARWFLRRPEVKDQPKPEPRPPQSTAWKLQLTDRADGSAAGEVRLSGDKLVDTPSSVFHAHVTGLRPDRAYDYKLSTPEGTVVRSGWFRTAPAQLTEPLVFVTGGDMGTTAARPINARAGKEDPLFALLGGDLAYANGKDQKKWYAWFDYWKELAVGADGRDIPMIAVIGNHETKSGGMAPENAPYYFDVADLPTGVTNFAVDFAGYLSFVNLDSNHVLKVEAQTGWLDGALEARRGHPHVFACYHRPAYGTGVKGNIIEIQKQWSPLFEKYGVDAVFENDHHVYKRTHRLIAGKPDPKGVLYLGDGAWGAGTRPITEAKLKAVGADKYLAKWASENHLIRVTISPDGSRHYEAKLADGTVLDETRDAAR